MAEKPIFSLHTLSPLSEDLDHPEDVAWGPEGYIYLVLEDNAIRPSCFCFTIANFLSAERNMSKKQL